MGYRDDRGVKRITLASWRGQGGGIEGRRPNGSWFALVAALVLLTAAPGALGAVLVEGSKLLASDGAFNDVFGYSVAISGNIIVVGAREDDDKGVGSGSAYVYERNAAGDWDEVQKLTASDGAAGDTFGWSVSISGGRIAIGAPDLESRELNGSVYLFERDGAGFWVVTERLVIPVEPVLPPASFGWAVGIDGDRIIVGALNDENNPVERIHTGSAHLFELVNGTWEDQERFVPIDPGPGDRFSWSVAVDGDRLAIGKPGGDDGAGSVHSYARDASGAWLQTQELVASDRAPAEAFGAGVAVDGGRLVVGAWEDQTASGRTGSAYIFEEDVAGTWTESRKLAPSDGAGGDDFGFSVGLDGDLLVVGAPADQELGIRVGSAFVFSPNRLPVAVAEPQTDAECVDGGETVMLDGSGSFDPDHGDSVAHFWSAPGISFDDPESATPRAFFPLGTTLVTLEVTDPHGASDTTTTMVTVVDTIPPAVDITRPVAGATYLFDDEVAPGTPGDGILAVGPLTVVAEAQDQCGLVRVDFASTTGAQESHAAAPFEFASDPGLLASGEITVTATALDLGGLAPSDDVRFTQVGTSP